MGKPASWAARTAAPASGVVAMSPGTPSHLGAVGRHLVVSVRQHCLYVGRWRRDELPVAVVLVGRD